MEEIKRKKSVKRSGKKKSSDVAGIIFVMEYDNHVISCQ